MTQELLCDLLRNKWFQDADYLALRLVNNHIGAWVQDHILCQWGLGLIKDAMRAQERAVRRQCELKSIRE